MPVIFFHRSVISGLNFPALTMKESWFAKKTAGREQHSPGIILKGKTAHLASYFNFTRDVGH